MRSVAFRRIPAKLSRPRLHGAVARERLFTHLDGEAERSLWWISGPPGAGKTTLVTTHLERSAVPVLWYRVDAGDADPATFFYYLGRAACALARKRLRLPLLTPEYLPDLGGFARRYFRSLYAALPGRAAVVFDGYEAAPHGALDGLLDVAVTELPAGQRLVVTSREELPGALAHWQAKGAAARVGWEALRLTRPEADGLATAAGVREAGAVGAVHALSDGWAAGFVLLLDHLRRTGTLDAGARGALRESLFGYFAHERFAGSDPSVRRLLLRTALLPGFTAAQAAALMQAASVHELLERLYREHYFLDRSAAGEPVYHYHALFREFLLQQGRESLEPQERARLLERTAALLAESGRAEEAIAAYTEAGAFEAAARAIGELAPDLLRQGRHAAVVQAIVALPQPLVLAQPWLSYWLGMARLPFDPPAGRSLLERAYAGFEAAADPTWCLLTASAIIESYMIEWSDMHGIDRWADAIAHYLHDDEARFPSVDVEARVLASCTGVVHRLKHAELMTEISARLFMLLPSIHDAGVRLAVVLPIFWHWIICGNWLHLRQLADEIKPTIPWQEVSPLAAIIWHMLEATLLHNSVEFERARAAFERTETLAATHGVRVYAAATAGYQVCMALNSGDLGAAEAQLAKMRAALDPARRLDVAHCHWAAGALALARGDLAAAAVHARKALVLARDCDSAPPIVHCQLLLAMVQMESGHVDAAAAEIDAALAYSIAARLGAYEQAALMLKAYLLLGADAEAEAGETLRRGLAIAREHEYRIIFPWAPAKVLQTLCGAALRFGVEVEYVRDLVRRLRFAPPDADAPGWPWPVQVYTLGRFAVLRDAAPLAFHGKAQRKPLELLKTLIVLGGEAVAEEELIGKLWPEPPADGGQKALDITVHRLRKLLGSNEALSITDRKISLDPAVVWTDVRVVERLLAHTAKLTEVELEQSGARLLDLYRGEFLTGDEETAVLVAARERLRGRLRRFIERLGAYWERGGRWVEAQELYHRGTELDPVAETLYRASMRCLARLGRPTEAIEAYVRCRRVLSLLLGTKPAAETEALHRELLSGNL